MKRDDEDWDWEARINIDNGIMGGKPVIKGTRVPVELIVGNLGGGATIQEICDDYLLSEQDVRAALIFAAVTLSKMRKHALPSR